LDGEELRRSHRIHKPLRFAAILLLRLFCFSQGFVTSHCASLNPQARPLPDFRDAHAAVRLPAHRDLVQPRSRVQAGAESVAAALVCADAPNIEMLTDFHPVDSVGNLAVLARLLDAWTEICVPQRDAPLVAA